MKVRDDVTMRYGVLSMCIMATDKQKSIPTLMRGVPPEKMWQERLNTRVLSIGGGSERERCYPARTLRSEQRSKRATRCRSLRASKRKHTFATDSETPL